MPKAPWKYTEVTGQVTIKIPPSVERVGSLDDSALLREAYPSAFWQKGSLVLSPADLVGVATSVENLAADQVVDDLSVGGALRWARRIIEELRKAGWAEYRWPMYRPTEAAFRAGRSVTAS